MKSADQPTAALLIIGDEVLSGKVEDQNGPFLIRALRTRGVQVTELRIIGDSLDGIVAAASQLSSSADHLFTTGGIGPTHDDVTIAAIARLLGRNVVRHPELERRLIARFGEPLPGARGRLADIPEGAEVILGESDTLPVIHADGIWVFPGVPSLMRICFERMADRMAGSPFFSEALYLDVAESIVAPTLTRLQNEHPEVNIGSYPRFGADSWRVKVTVDGRQQAAVEAAIASLRAALDPAWLVDEAGGGTLAGG